MLLRVSPCPPACVHGHGWQHWSDVGERVGVVHKRDGPLAVRDNGSLRGVRSLEGSSKEEQQEEEEGEGRRISAACHVDTWAKHRQTKDLVF